MDARTLGGIATLIVGAVLCLLYLYRRRTYILCWVSGWALTGIAMLLAGHRFDSEKAVNAGYGVSQFLSILGALAFVLGADAYRSRLRLRRNYVLILLPLLIWFALAPVALKAPAAFGPGHLLIAATLAAASLGHFLLLRRARLLGALVVGSAFLAMAAANVWLLVALPHAINQAVGRTTFLNLALYLVAALGMQLMTFEDMTYELRVTNKQLETAQGELRELVTTDALTGCRNRRFFDQIIWREVQRHRRYELPLSLVFVDVDRFKTINDTLGHETGDRVLKRVGAFLTKNVREADYVFRWGGDEFLILMSCREPEAIRKAAELKAAFARTDAKGLPAGVGLSIGCADVPEDAKDIVALVRAADERMYRDKRRTGSAQAKA